MNLVQWPCLFSFLPIAKTFRPWSAQSRFEAPPLLSKSKSVASCLRHDLLHHGACGVANSHAHSSHGIADARVGRVLSNAAHVDHGALVTVNNGDLEELGGSDIRTELAATGLAKNNDLAEDRDELPEPPESVVVRKLVTRVKLIAILLYDVVKYCAISQIDPFGVFIRRNSYQRQAPYTLARIGRRDSGGLCRLEFAADSHN